MTNRRSLYGKQTELDRIGELFVKIDAEIYPEKDNDAPKIIKGLELYLEDIKNKKDTK